MNILIVDDDNRRAEYLFSVLIENAVTAKECIKIVDSISKAKEILLNSYFDAMLIDVVLPIRSDDTPDPQNTFNFLHVLSRSSFYKKPEKIIGITAHIGDISNFKESFDQFCLTVIEADRNEVKWIDRLVLSLKYTSASKIVREVEVAEKVVVTVHGIRTFGHWQTRFQRLLEIKASGISFSNYRYGYFSLFSFAIPYFRNKEVARFSSYLHPLLLENAGKSISIFCHSFGTLIVVDAIKKLVEDGYNPQIQSLILCGSVLPVTYDWRLIQNSSDVTIVNECTDFDYILWLSEALIIGTGMAGKSGFVGFNDSRFINRFFRGGHSSYFENNFMEQYWVPLLTENNSVAIVDDRVPSTLMHGFLEKGVQVLGITKNYLYVSLFLFLFYFCFFI